MSRLNLTVGLVCSDTIFWVDVLYIVKSPLSIVCLPLQNVEFRKCGVPFHDPSGLGLPLRASLSPPAMFTSKSFGLVEQLIELNLDHPSRCVFMRKSGAEFHLGTWYCSYDGQFKTCLTPPNETKNTSSSARPTHANVDGNDGYGNTSLCGGDGDLSSVECDSDDEIKPDDLSFWFPDDDDWAFRSSANNADARAVDRERLPPCEASALEGLISDVVDESKYYVSVNTLNSIVTARWKHSERAANWAKFCTSKQTIDILGRKKLHSSSSSSLSLHSYTECVLRAKRWAVWHSTWVYDTRPTSPSHKQCWTCQYFVHGIQCH